MRITRRLIAWATLAGLVLLTIPQRSFAASQAVTIRDNYYAPQEVHIDPGDSVVWTNQGSNTHTVNSDTKDFKSGDIRPGRSFSQSFQQEGYYYYHCNYHGGRDQVGQWGVIIVGNPPPPEEEEETKDERPKIRVPQDFSSVKKAVNRAKPGSTVVIGPGVYHEAAFVQTKNLVIRGVDRFRTVLTGDDKKGNGFTVTANNVTIKNLTVREYTGNGVYFNDVKNYKVVRVDAIKNRTYGIYAFDSYNGIFRDSFGWGSGDSAFYIGQCLGCGGLIENVHAEKNFLGYSGTNATGVTIRNSTWVHNGAGIVPNTLPTETLGPNRGTFIYNNVVRNNNYDSIPAAGFSETAGIPFGTGIWLPEVHNSVVKKNIITGHNRYGVLISQGFTGFAMNNRVRKNYIRDSGMYDLAWDGTGADNCFTANDINGETGPPEIQTLFACANRPFVGVPFAPVQSDILVNVLAGPVTREQKEPPEPKRPRCQRGAPGCNR